MKKHTFDPLSFIFGVIFLGSAAAAVWRDELRWDLDEWFLPVVVLIGGVALLASALRVTISKDDDSPPSPIS